MKKFWNIVATVAFVNVLALSGLVGWLGMTDRLSRDRVKALRELFAMTLAEESAAKSAAIAAEEERKREAEEAERLGRPPRTAAGVIDENRADSDTRLQLAMRRAKEVEMLRAALDAQMATLEQRENRLKEERAAFEAERVKVAEVAGAEQFKAALITLEALKPGDAKLVLGALLGAREVDQVVAYLSKMEEGKRAKVIGEFVKEDPAVAAELLERLRTWGVTMHPGVSRTPGTNESQPVPTPSTASAAGGPGGSR